jgi:hypothetical protein
MFGEFFRCLWQRGRKTRCQQASTLSGESVQVSDNAESPLTTSLSPEIAAPDTSVSVSFEPVIPDIGEPASFVIEKSVSAGGWTWCCHSRVGATHVRMDRGNQDFCTVQDYANGIVLVAADGHGTPRAFRSDIGSQCACVVAKEMLQGSLQGPEFQSVDAIQSDLPRRLAEGWWARVAEHIEKHPRKPEEPQDLTHAAYGSTCVLAAIQFQPPRLLLVQIGDGDAVVRRPEGCSLPNAPREKLLGVETHSLAEEPSPDKRGLMTGGARTRVRSLVLPLEEVTGLVLSTDGVSNAFVDQAGFLAFAAGCMDAASQGTLAEDIDAWLSELSAQGSGDDVTLVAVVRQPEHRT